MRKNLFDEVVGEMPPSTVNTGEIVRREKRRKAIRAVSFATALVAVSVGAGLTISGMGGTPARSAASAFHTAPSPAASASRTAPPTCASRLKAGPGGRSCQSTQTATNRFAIAAYDDRSAAATAKQLSTVFDDALHQEAPDASWIFEPDYVGQPRGPDGQPPQLTYDLRNGLPGNSGSMFSGGSGVVNDGRKGSLQLSVTPNPDQVAPTGEVIDLLKCEASRPNCVEGTGPEGQKTVRWTIHYEPAPGSDVPFISCIVDVGLPGGRVLQLEGSNDFGIDGDPAAQRLTPLTSNQVSAIAIDIAGHIKS